MQLTVTTFLSVDGVYQGPGGRDEDRSDGFEREGGELQVHGSGQLVRFLLEHDLVDRLYLLVFPVMVGAGRRLFSDSGIATGLALDESRTTPSGVTISVYPPTGRAEFGEVEVT
jgi:dihydrofolate reductase